MSSQNQWSDIGSVVGRNIVHGFPRIGLTRLMISFFMLKDFLGLWHRPEIEMRIKSMDVLFPPNITQISSFLDTVKKVPQNLWKVTLTESVAVSRLYWWLFLICFVLCFPMNGLKVFPHSRAALLQWQCCLCSTLIAWLVNGNCFRQLFSPHHSFFATGGEDFTSRR